MHTPVLLHEVVTGLDVRKGRRYIDATAGEGGHIRAIVEAGAEVLGIDRDQAQIDRLKKEFAGESRLILAGGSFGDIAALAAQYDFKPADGVLFDLGLSMKQLTTSGRGFSYKELADPLDMRLDTNEVETAADLINRGSVQELYYVFARNAEEPASYQIAEAVVRQRTVKKIATVSDLTDCLNKSSATPISNDTLARVFQALRMAVNREIEALQKGLDGALSIVRTPGKIAVITFHSVEDRIVKRWIEQHGLKKNSRLVFPKKDKRFTRSAKLRLINV
ncbi:16S rRNA (cytosine(1402)-N(4))-methyltransferase RsmH [Candidatus Roizmanbacteria bacterium]|nr:16S rRNA (cytosine(1402)-N(4))-methyltransferase RsmH [Candidatus Roizmanbacteria bacterium]